MKLLMYMPTPGGMTGAPRRMLTLARELKDLGSSVFVASESGSELLAAARQSGIATIELDAVGSLSERGEHVFRRGGLYRLWLLMLLVRQNLRVLCAAKKVGADAVWLRGSKGILFAGVGCFLARKPIVWDVDYELPSVGLVRKLHRVGLWLSSAVIFQYLKAPEAIFGSGICERYEHKFTSLMPGIDLERVPRPGSNTSFKAGISDRPKVVLQVGTVCDRKNQCFTAGVLAKVRELNPSLNVQLHVVGGLNDENYVQKLRRSVSELGLDPVTRIWGWSDDVGRFLSMADLLIMPSKDEGVPNTVQEAMYLGVPVLVSDVGGMAEMVQRDVTGWVCSLNDPEQWAKDMIMSLEDISTTKAVVDRASQYASEHFGTVVWGERYLSVIEEVVSGQRG